MGEMNPMLPSRSLQDVDGPTICDLPEEVLVYIMSHLSFRDRKRTRRVCKRLNEVSYSYSLIKNDWLVLPSVPALKELNLPAHWNVFNIRISKVGHEYRKTNFWELFGSNITKIELKKVSMQNRVMADILKFCANLRSLSLIGCVRRRLKGVSFAESGPFFPSKQERLRLDRIVNLSDKEFKALTENACNLTEFYLYDYQYYFKRGSHSYWSSRHILDQEPCEMDLVKVPSVLSLVKRQAPRWSKFVILNTDLTAENLIQILSSKGN